MGRFNKADYIINLEDCFRTEKNIVLVFPEMPYGGLSRSRTEAFSLFRQLLEVSQP